VTLSAEQRAGLCEFLERGFTLDELKRLAFDLGLEFRLYALRRRARLAVELVREVERQGRLGCLLDALVGWEEEQELAALRDRRPPCVPYAPVEAVFGTPETWPAADAWALKSELAARFRVAVHEVTLIGATGPEVRLLVGLPAASVHGGGEGGLGARHGTTVRAWEGLDGRAQRAWRAAVCRWPPRPRGRTLRPAVTWARAQRAGWRGWLWVAVPLGTAVLLAGGLWVAREGGPAAERAGAGLRAAWAALRARGARAAHETGLWLQFLGSLVVSLIALSWFSALSFALLGALVRVLPRLLDAAAVRFPRARRLPRMGDAARRALAHGRAVGTALNLAASGCALGLLAWLVPGPLDGWDLGIQGLIAVAVELVVLGLLFRDARFDLRAWFGP
jgi:hypothetical protein